MEFFGYSTSFERRELIGRGEKKLIGQSRLMILFWVLKRF